MPPCLLCSVMLLQTGFTIHVGWALHDVNVVDLNLIKFHCVAFWKQDVLFIFTDMLRSTLGHFLGLWGLPPPPPFTKGAPKKKKERGKRGKEREEEEKKEGLKRKTYTCRKVNQHDEGGAIQAQARAPRKKTLGVPNWHGCGRHSQNSFASLMFLPKHSGATIGCKWGSVTKINVIWW